MSSKGQSAGRDTLSSLGEFGLIDRLTGITSIQWPSGQVGPGDDCAIFPLTGRDQQKLLCTTDTAIENVHFRLSHSTAHDLGWKVLAVSLSDIAAVGGVPHLALLNLQLRPEVEILWIEEFYRGIAEIADKFSVMVVGGDTVSATELGFTSTVIGFSIYDPILRSTAQVGDDIWVSGSIGDAALGFSILEGTWWSELTAEEKNEPILHFRRPTPRVALGQVLAREQLANSMIDISDGLIQDVGHLADKSGVVIEIDLASLPLNAVLKENIKTLLIGITGGEDYELLFSADSSSANRLKALSGAVVDGVVLPKLTKIGKITETGSDSKDLGIERVYLKISPEEIRGAKAFLSQSGLKSGGFSHF